MEEFIELHKKLDRQCSYYCRHLGHLKGLIDNDDWLRVVDDSMSGRVLLLGNSEITNALILFNTRMFDTGPDAITIHSLSRKLPNEEQVKEHHNSRMQRLGFDYELERYYSARVDFVTAKRGLKNSRTEEKLRHLRNYTLAHNIEPETEPERATLNDLVQLTEDVNNLVDLAGYIIDSSCMVYRDFAKRTERETKMLYAALPALAKKEQELD